MELTNIIASAFTADGLAGNQAGVCVLEEWLPDPTMQAIAAHNGLPETAFLVDDGDRLHIRWFTPTQEANMCGHATLASVRVLRKNQTTARSHYRFRSSFGYEMEAGIEGDLIVLDFPAGHIEPSDSQAPVRALGVPVCETLVGQSWVCRLADEEAVRNFEPDYEAIAALREDGIIITAPGRHSDIVSRYFTPQSGIPEDPVTGYAHTLLVPYWAGRLGKADIHALQVSARGGELFCTLAGDRVILRGRGRIDADKSLHIDDGTGAVSDI